MRNNINHPSKGSSTKVEPIRRIEDVQAIKTLLQNQPRYLMLFTLGINNGLRIGDLLQIKVRDVQRLKSGDVLRVREQKTGKDNILLINKSSWKVLQKFLDHYNPDGSEYVFRSQKRKDQPIGVSYANRLVKEWCQKINLRGNYGTHTLCH